MVDDAATEIEILDKKSCWELFLTSNLGRLAVSVGGSPKSSR